MLQGPLFSLANALAEGAGCYSSTMLGSWYVRILVITQSPFGTLRINNHSRCSSHLKVAFVDRLIFIESGEDI